MPLISIDPALDYVTPDGLRMKIGVDIEDPILVPVIIKENFDNHVTPALHDFDPQVYFGMKRNLIVTGNNGEPFPIQRLYSIYDPYLRASSKLFPKFERGFVGHFLKVEAGLQTLRGSYVVLVTKNGSFRICYRRNGSVQPLIEKVEEKLENEGNLTEFHLPMPIPNYHDALTYVMNYVACNPHVTFMLDSDFGESVGDHIRLEAVTHKHPPQRAHVTWLGGYKNFSHLIDLCAQEGLSTAVFVKEFEGGDMLNERLRARSLGSLNEEEKQHLYEVLLQADEPEVSLFTADEYLKRLQQINEVKDYGFASESVRDTKGYFVYAITVFAADLESIIPFFTPREYVQNLAVITCVNSSPLLGNVWYGSKGTYYVYDSQRDNLFQYMLKKSNYKCNFLIVDLALPKPPWTNYSKDELSVGVYLNMFKKLLKKALNSLSRGTRSHNSRGRVCSRARQELEEEIRRRIILLREHGEIPLDQWIPQNGLWYKIRRIVGSDREMGIERKNFLNAIDDICKQYGYRRDQLGITCAPRGEFYYRGENYPLSFEMIKKLASIGTDIVCIEKEGVPRALKDIAKDYSIAFTHSRGFVVEYGVDLINLARETGANVVMITDLDDAGLAMKYTLPEIERIGVDDEMIRFFGLNKEELQEKYTPSDHFKFLLDKAPEQAALVAEYRIEIDSVLAAVGPRRFFEYILYKLQKLFPTRNYNRAISVAPVMPKDVDELIETLKDHLYDITKNEINAIKQKLQSWPGLEKVDILENEIKETLLRKELENEELKNIIKEIKAVTEKIKSLRGVSGN
jgi:hypothetical protein